MDTPLLLIIWRRPHTLRKVIDAIRPVAPTRLFVACDGPATSRPEEYQKVAESRAVIDNEIDWPCDIERLYAENNLGCRLGVSRAITWFFSHVEYGIILEDDCVPHPDFFVYCTSLLKRYLNDSRVWCISGNNFQNGRWRGNASYYFSRYNHCWGWASWRRCWTQYDGSLSAWPDLRRTGLLRSFLEDPIEREYWTQIWNRMLAVGKPDTWDYQWTFTCFANGGLTALPNRNLVSNVGFGADATHTTNTLQRIPVAQSLGVLTHPHFVLRDTVADSYTFSHHYANYRYSLVSRLFFALKLSLRHILFSRPS